MNRNISFSVNGKPTPLSARPESVKIREQLNTHSLISSSLAQELGTCNQILNFLAGCHHVTIHYGDGYYEINADGRVAYGMDMREAIMDLRQ